MRGTDDGFSLIEAMVAMVILAVAGIALVGTTEAHIRRIADLENRAAELAVGAVALDEDGDGIAMLGGTWRVRHEIDDTDDPVLARVTISVTSEDDGRRYARYIAFVDREAVQ